MAERYSRLYSLPENQYTAGAPVLIAAGALLKDNQTGKALAQIKFKSISEKQIKAVKISVVAFDVSGKELEGIAEYQYLDLNVGRNAEFGQKQAVTLPDAVTHSFKVKCTDVFFADGSAWCAAPDAVWNSLPAQETVSDKLGSLAAQYQRDTSARSKFIPAEHEDLWFCSCGALNSAGEAECHTCKQSKEKLFAALELEALDQRNEAYKAAEAEKAAKQAEADKIQNAKTKKFAIIAAAVVAVIVVVSLIVTNVIIPNNQYKDALTLMEAGQYTEAIAVFEALEGHKDSVAKIDECNLAILEIKYNDALELVEAGELAAAYDAFMALEGFKDSAEKAKIVFDEYKIEKLKKATVGDYVFLGTYEQDDVSNNGKENIEWLVLNKIDSKVLLISKYAFERMAFGGSSKWENCALRKWLNDEFVNSAFNDKEKDLLSGNTELSTNDKVFLLSAGEVRYYFPSESSRRCKPTHAMERSYNDNGHCWWWTRTDGSISGAIITVWDDGTIWTKGTSVDGDTVGVRPAMWIDLSVNE